MSGASRRKIAGAGVPDRGDRLIVTVSGNTSGLKSEIIDVAGRALRSQGLVRGSLHVAVVGDTVMRRQHRRWLGEDSTTDVLTFDLRDVPKKGFVEGELLVCSALARRRARADRRDWKPELLLYVVHGCLHLSGRDDCDESQAARMHRIEDRILSSLGWGPVYSSAYSEVSPPRRRAASSKRAAMPRPRHRRT